MRKAFPNCHLEQCVGTHAANVAYIKKDGDVWYEEGEINEQTPLKDVLADCDSVQEVMERYPEVYCRYVNGIKDIYRYRNEKKQNS